MVTVSVPNRHYRGVIGGVSFENGKGVFEDVELAKSIAKEFGFDVIEAEAPAAVEVDEKPKARRPRKAKDGE